MPLHSQHEVVGAGTFEGLDDAVLGTMGHDQQAFSDSVGRLMMRCVYRPRELIRRTVAKDATNDGTIPTVSTFTQGIYTYVRIFASL